MSIVKGLWINEAANTINPGGLSNTLINSGWMALLPSIRAALRRAPDISFIFLNNPWGRWADPDAEDTEVLQTQMKQIELCKAESTTRHLADRWAFTLFIRAVRRLGIDVRAYIGYEPIAGWNTDDLFDWIGLLCSLRIPFTVDGLAAREGSRAIIGCGREWGAPWVGVEAVPDRGTVYATNTQRATALESTFLSAMNAATSALPVRNPVDVLMREPYQADLATVLANMRPQDCLISMIDTLEAVS